MFEQQYKSLRDRFYAHRNRTVRVERLFESTRIEQVEQMLAFLGSVYQALWETFINGQEFLLTPEPCSLHEMREHAINGKGANGTGADRRRGAGPPDVRGTGRLIELDALPTDPPTSLIRRDHLGPRVYGEYLNATFTAKRHAPAPRTTIRIPTGPPLAT